ncbi:MAG: hypothetical protein WCQ32_00375 [bacterium]
MKQILLFLIFMISVGFTNKVYIFSTEKGDILRFRLEIQHSKTLGVIIEVQKEISQKDLQSIGKTDYVTIFYTKNNVLYEKLLHINTAIISQQTISLSFLCKTPTECREIGESTIQKVIL